MIKFLILPLFFLLSCVSEQETVTSTRAVRRYEPQVVTIEDSERIQAICRALQSKEDLLSVLVSTGTQYTFIYAEKGCSDAKLSTPKNLVTTIEKSGSDYFFKTKNNELFAFSDVETTSKGVMAEICQNLSSSLTSPMQTKTGAIWFTTFTSAEHCQADANGLCIHLQRGSAIDNVNYQIHTDEWIKIKLTNEKRGFFIERKIISSANCSGKGTVERTAVLR